MLDPVPAGQRFVAGQVHAAIGSLAFVSPLRCVGQDVMHSRKFLTNPVGNSILVVDVIDTKLGNELSEVGVATIVLDAPQRLSVEWPIWEEEVERGQGPLWIQKERELLNRASEK